MWVGEKECSSIIEKAWRQVDGSNSLSRIMKCISTCAKDLGRWNQTSFGHVHKELASTKLRLNLLQENDLSCYFLAEHNKAKEEVQKWLEKDELMWIERSRVMWLREGDSNLKYFHSKASS
ncbi:hypothetical protein I3760_11G109900 [Carya illinoinensis]|nr:hypothetical protein I3760_11G109900 [Carya illinoinensis]